VSVTPADLAAALDDVPARARQIAERRAEIERQHARVDDLRSRAVRVSVSGLVFDLDGHILCVRSVIGGPTPRGSDVLYHMALLPISEEDVEDFHGGWA